MIVVLSPGVETSLSEQNKGRYIDGPVRSERFRAVLRPEEDHLCVYTSDMVPTDYLPPPIRHVDCFIADLQPHHKSRALGAVKAPGEGPHLLLCVDPAGLDATSAFYFASSSSQGLPCMVEPIRLESELFSRVKGIFDSADLSEKTVCVIGLGSGGSFGAVELAKCGVGTLILVDFDRLHTHNISRHVCGIKDVGRFKTHAVRDMIVQHSPNAKVQCWETDITENDDQLEQLIVGSDLVFVATDNEVSKYLINDTCVSKGVPAVYGGVYERAFAGETVRVIPGLTGCYACVRQGLSETTGSLTAPSESDYTDDPDLEAEPGLGLDVGFIASLHTKLALLTLLRGSDTTIQDIDSEMIIWVNSAKPEDGDLFATPLSRYFVRVPRVKDCPACGSI
jgi:molybdopterin/thiamine biosynthesis adenylyltransferase